MPKRKAPQQELDDSPDLSPQLREKQLAENTNLTKPNGSTNLVKKRKIKTEIVANEIVESQAKPNRSRKQKVKTEELDVEETDEPDAEEASPKQKRQRKVKEEQVEDVESAARDGEATQKTTKAKRKTKEEKEAEAMPLAARTVGHKLYIGAHVSAAGGVHNAVANSVHIGANCFALFLKSQRKWANPPMIDEHCLSFHDHCKTNSYDQKQHVVPHGSYLVNLAHTDKSRTEQAYESYLDDLKRCERLGIKLYNIHPGNTVKNDRQEAISHLAQNINRAHTETSSVITLLENMAAGGNVLGSTFEDLRDIIAQVRDQTRIGVCIDTCHAFAAGYDLRTPDAFDRTLAHFDATVGLRYLRALHINDSKAPFRSHRDLHANIGTGFLGLRAFHNVVNETRFAGLPLVLETPITVRDAEGQVVLDEKKKKEKEDKGIWAGEIKMLERLVGMDVDGEEFLEMETRLARQGEPERARLAEQMERKKEKSSKAGKKRKGKKDGSENQDEESELSDLEEA